MYQLDGLICIYHTNQYEMGDRLLTGIQWGKEKSR